ncbi:MAG: holin family protein [Waterburya sp.]
MILHSTVAEIALGFGGKLIDKIWPDKIAQETERAKAQLALMELQQAGEFKKLEISMGAILAEANSSDPWTSRARPSFMYVIYVMILASIPMGFMAAFFPVQADAVINGMGKWLNAIPEALYALFGAGYLGYTGFRSWDKKNGTVS